VSDSVRRLLELLNQQKLDLQTINTSVETHPRVAAPRPYHQKMLVAVARKAAADVNTENSKSRDFPCQNVTR
jgi:predicted house-cleaning NTP pyrophosphatase (Maf/HAM1 superfamily)